MFNETPHEGKKERSIARSFLPVSCMDLRGTFIVGIEGQGRREETGIAMRRVNLSSRCEYQLTSQGNGPNFIFFSLPFSLSLLPITTTHTQHEQNKNIYPSILHESYTRGIFVILSMHSRFILRFAVCDVNEYSNLNVKLKQVSGTKTGAFDMK